MGSTKSTKKFQKNHLKHTLDQRKVEKKYKQKTALQKKKGKDVYFNEVEDDGTPKRTGDELFEDMSVEDFFKGGFEVPTEQKEKKSKKAQAKADKKDDKKADSVSHRNDLDDLAKNDPEFYKYLQENDKNLLNFDPSKFDDEDEEDEDIEEGEEDHDLEALDDIKATASDDEEDSSTVTVEVTMKQVNKWKNLMAEQKSLATLKKVLQAFKAAVNSSNDDETTNYKYSVTNPDVFNALVVLTLKNAHAVIQHHVPLKKQANGPKTVADESSKKYRALTPILKSHAGSLVTILTDMNNTETVALVLASIQELTPYFLSYRKVLKTLITAVIDIWGIATDIQTRIVAFSFLLQSAKENQKALLEMVLKLSYSGFVKHCHQTSIHTMDMINFQKNSAVELFSINPTVSYQHGFEFIRQLAIHLRNSMTDKNKKDAYKTVYNWQYCHSLDFWSRVLSSACDPNKEALEGKESPLRGLIYPLVQVTLGAMRLIPTPQYFPLRFYLVRSLIRVSRQTGVYIPLLPILTELLASNTITKNPKASTLKPLDFDHNIRANKAYLGTRVYQDGVCEQLVELSAEFFVLHTKSIAFPELATPGVIAFKRFTKRSKNIKLNKLLQTLIEKLEANTKFIEQKRSSVDFGPQNKQQVSKFLQDQKWDQTPLGAYVVVQRQVKEERARILKESLEADAEEEKQKKLSINGGDDEDILDLDEEEEDSDSEAEDSDVDMEDDE